MTPVSIRHPAIKYARALARAPFRRQEGAYLAEGVRLVSEALATGQQCPLVLYVPEALNQSTAGNVLLAGIPSWADRALEVTPAGLRRAAQTENPAGILAVLRFPVEKPLHSHNGDGRGLILDRLSDPGNAGTILRTAAAFGAGFVISTPSSVDLFSPKVVRAGMGAHFRLPLYSHVEWPEIVAALPDVELVGAAANRGEAVGVFDWPERLGLVIGGEIEGLSADARSHISRMVHIPMRSGVESLNAAVSAAILLFAALGHSDEKS